MWTEWVKLKKLFCCSTIMHKPNFLGIIASNFCLDYMSQIVYCVFFGATSGSFLSLTPVILIDLIGMDSLIQAYGIQLLCFGLARIIGPPIIGNLMTWRENFFNSFFPPQVHSMMQLETILLDFTLLAPLSWFLDSFSCSFHGLSISRRKELMKCCNQIRPSPHQPSLDRYTLFIPPWFGSLGYHHLEIWVRSRQA